VKTHRQVWPVLDRSTLRRTPSQSTKFKTPVKELPSEKLNVLGSDEVLPNMAGTYRYVTVLALGMQRAAGASNLHAGSFTRPTNVDVDVARHANTVSWGMRGRLQEGLSV
jgi:hypothetical protein